MAASNLILERENDPITPIERHNPFNLRERPGQKGSILSRPRPVIFAGSVCHCIKFVV